MKKLIATIIILFIVMLSGCDESDIENSITVAELTDRENAMLDIVAENSFAFDYKVKDYKEVTIWLEKYEYGEKVDEKIGWMMSTIEESGSIIFTTSKRTDGQNSNSFNIGVLSNGGSASIIGSENFPNGLPNIMSTWGSISESIAIDGEMVLAAICYSDNDHGMSGLTTSFFEDPDGHMSDLEEYNVAYLLKVEFSE